jgi:hypothetical protein
MEEGCNEGDVIVQVEAEGPEKEADIGPQDDELGAEILKPREIRSHPEGPEGREGEGVQVSKVTI